MSHEEQIEWPSFDAVLDDVLPHDVARRLRPETSAAARRRREAAQARLDERASRRSALTTEPSTHTEVPVRTETTARTEGSATVDSPSDTAAETPTAAPAVTDTGATRSIISEPLVFRSNAEISVEMDDVLLPAPLPPLELDTSSVRALLAPSGKAQPEFDLRALEAVGTAELDTHEPDTDLAGLGADVAVLDTREPEPAPAETAEPESDWPSFASVSANDDEQAAPIDDGEEPSSLSTPEISDDGPAVFAITDPDEYNFDDTDDAPTGDGLDIYDDLTVLDTDPIIDTDPVFDTDPVIDTDPVFDTGPVFDAEPVAVSSDPFAAPADPPPSTPAPSIVLEEGGIELPTPDEVDVFDDLAPDPLGLRQDTAPDSDASSGDDAQIFELFDESTPAWSEDDFDSVATADAIEDELGSLSADGLSEFGSNDNVISLYGDDTTHDIAPDTGDDDLLGSLSTDDELTETLDASSPSVEGSTFGGSDLGSLADAGTSWSTLPDEPGEPEAAAPEPDAIALDHTAESAQVVTPQIRPARPKWRGVAKSDEADDPWAYMRPDEEENSGGWWANRPKFFGGDERRRRRAEREAAADAGDVELDDMVSLGFDDRCPDCKQEVTVDLPDPVGRRVHVSCESCKTQWHTPYFMVSEAS